MATLDLHTLSTAEKLQLMEEIWEDLTQQSDVISPSWHTDVLKETNRLIDSGEESYIDWEIAKQQLRAELL